MTSTVAQDNFFIHVNTSSLLFPYVIEWNSQYRALLISYDIIQEAYTGKKKQ